MINIKEQKSNTEFLIEIPKEIDYETEFVIQHDIKILLNIRYEN